jgi:hypothetical protein
MKTGKRRGHTVSRTSKKHQGFWSTIVLGGVLIACAQEQPPARDARTRTVVSSASSSSNDTVVYDLVLDDEQSLPLAPDTTADGCTRQLLSGWYRIAGDRWASFDSLTFHCPPELARRPHTSEAGSGTIKRNGSALSFWGGTKYGDQELDRGHVHGDTLITRGQDLGPWRIYVRRRGQA